MMALRMCFSRSLHVSPTRRAWFMAPLARVLVALGARVGRSAWSRMSKDSRQAVRSALGTRMVLGGVGVGSACCIGYYVYHIEEAPVTKRRRFMMISRQRLTEMMEAEREELMTMVTLGRPVLPITNPAYDQVVPILQRILPVLNNHWTTDVDMEQVKWTLFIIDSPTANAVCLPSGEVYVHSGLLQACHNQDELALILAHEMSHVLLNHGGELFSNKGLLDFFQLFVVAAIWFVIPNDLVSALLHKYSHSLSSVLFHLPYSRQLEEEADMVGLMLMSGACFQPDTSVQVWTHLPSNSGGPGQLPEYLSTHPVNEQRLVTLKELLPLANEMWAASDCGQMHDETRSFKRLVNKTLKGMFSR